MANSEAMTSSTRSFAYSYRLVKKCFVKICETSKCHNFLIFQPIFIRFSLFCSENFTLSSEIMLNLFRSSPLKRWGITDSDLCPCGQMQTHEHVIKRVLSDRTSLSTIRNKQSTTDHFTSPTANFDCCSQQTRWNNDNLFLDPLMCQPINPSLYCLL